MNLFSNYIQKIQYALRLFKKAFGKYRFQILLTTVLGFLAGIFGGFGIGSLIPLFSLTTGQADATDPITTATKQIFSHIHISFSIPFVLLFMLLLFAAKAVVTFIAAYTNNRIETNFQQDTRSMLLKKTLSANWLFLLNQKIGYIDRVILEDVPQSSGILIQVSDAVLRLTTMAMYTFVAFKISSTITIVTFIVGGFLFLCLKPLFYRIRKLANYMSILGKDAAHYIIQTMTGIKSIKASSVENYVAQQGKVYFDEMKHSRTQSLMFELIPSTLFEPISFLFIIILFAIYHSHPDFNIASFAVIIYLIQKIFGFIQNIQVRLGGINAALPYLDLMLKYRDTLDKNQEVQDGGENFSFAKELSLENVSFNYPGHKEILTELSLKITRGETIGLIGPSGAGKTTLVDILLRLLDPVKGRIVIDGEDIVKISRQNWSKHVGYVSQDIFLLNDTIENNIRFYNADLSHKDIATAAQMANIHDFIETLPEKYQTIVGERGIKLSGGQRQRIVLARVLARRPDVLILDEATSALDNESEMMIQETIRNLKNKVTVLMIAHRLSTVMIADKVIALENGRVVESGSPEELMKNEDSYLYRTYHIRS